MKVILTESDQVAPFHFWLKSCNFVERLARRFGEATELKRDFYELMLPCCHNRVLREEVVKPSVLQILVMDESIYKFDLLAPFVSRSTCPFFMELFREAFSWFDPIGSEFGQIRLGVLKFIMRLVRLSDSNEEDKCRQLVSLMIELLEHFSNHGLLLKAITVFVTEMVSEGAYRYIFLEEVIPVLIECVADAKSVVLYAWAMNALSDIYDVAKDDVDLMMELSAIPEYTDKCKDLILNHKLAILRPYGGPVVPVNRPPDALDLFEPIVATIDK